MTGDIMYTPSHTNDCKFFNFQHTFSSYSSVFEFSAAILEKGLLGSLRELRSWCFKGPLKYLLMPLLGKNQLAITLHMYSSIGPNLDNTHRGQI